MHFNLTISRPSVFRSLMPLAGVAVLAAGLTACGSAEENAAASADAAEFVIDGNFSLKPEAERAAAPSFELTDQNGDLAKLSDYAGKVVLVNFWATWCGPCRVEMPWFDEFEQQYKDQGFAVVGISLDETGWDVVKPFLSEHPYDYRFVVGNEQTAQMYGMVESLPTTLLIDREGRVAAFHIGLPEGEREEYESEIKALL